MNNEKSKNKILPIFKLTYLWVYNIMFKHKFAYFFYQTIYHIFALKYFKYNN